MGTLFQAERKALVAAHDYPCPGRGGQLSKPIAFA